MPSVASDSSRPEFLQGSRPDAAWVHGAAFAPGCDASAPGIGRAGGAGSWQTAGGGLWKGPLLADQDPSCRSRGAKLRMKSKNLLVRDEQVDPIFRCKVCDTPAYADADSFVGEGSAQVRTLDPASQKPLGWVNHRFCANCEAVVKTCFQWDTATGGKYAGMSKKELLKQIEEKKECKDEFLERKRSLNAALTSGLGTPGCTLPSSAGRGSHIQIDTVLAHETVQDEAEFWPMDIYKAHYGSGEPSSRGHAKFAYKGQQGVLVFVRPRGVILLRPSGA